MRKILKRIYILFTVCAFIVGIMLVVYYFNDKNKVADVVALDNYAMDSYWGDEIESYGTVTADKAQIVYISKTDKITGINYGEGDHVNAGDVLFTVDEESVDIKGKALELQKAIQDLGVDQRKMDRLKNAKPVADPAYIISDNIEQNRVYVSESEYKVDVDDFVGKFKDEMDQEHDVAYSKGDKFAVVTYSPQGETLSTVYYDNYGNIISNYVGTKVEEDDGTLFTHTDSSSTYTWTRKIDYYDDSNGKYLGSDVFDENGETVSKFEPQSGYTATQLKEEIESKEQEIKHKELNIKILSNELESMKKTASTGEVVAKVSGTITKMQDKDNVNYKKPFLTVAATDEYYIAGYVGEYELSKINLGDVVSITSWDNGVTTDATIVAIDDSPSKNDNFGGDNSNSSSYEFRATFDRSCGIDLGAAVDIKISSGEEEKGVYLTSALIRKDIKGNYVMKKNSDNKLEKVYVKVGKTLWGSYTEIKSGLSMNDYLAFPYGNGAREGINCQVKDSLETY